MKKRILAALLTVVLTVSLLPVTGLTLSAETVMGKSKSAMVMELTDFIKVCLGSSYKNHLSDHAYDEGQIGRDDYWNMPEGMNTRHPLTAALMEKGEQAVEIRARADIAEMDAFLVSLYGGWKEILDEDGEGTGKFAYGDENLPYTEFQDTLNLRWGYDNYLYDKKSGVEYTLYYGEKSFKELNREDYTIESWEVLRDVVQNIDDMQKYDPEIGGAPLGFAKRSEMYTKIQEYYAEYDKLVPFEGDKQVNKYRGHLFDVIANKCELHRAYPWELETIYQTMDVTDPADSPEYAAFKNFVDNCRAVYADPNATVEELTNCLDMVPFYIIQPAENTPFEAGVEYHMKKDDLEKALLSEQLLPANVKSLRGSDGKQIEGEFIEYFEYQEKMSSFLEAFRNNVFLSTKFREAKNVYFNQAKLDLANGRYGEETSQTKNPYFAEFLKGFEQGDAIIYSYLTKESQFYAALKTIEDAYAVLRTHISAEPQYVLSFKIIMAWFSEPKNLAIYTDESVARMNTAIQKYNDDFALFTAGDVSVTEEKLYEDVLSIYTQKDDLVLIATETDDSLDLESVLNQMTLMLDEFTFIKDEFDSMFDGVSLNDTTSECYDIFNEAYTTFESLVTKGLNEVVQKEADPKYEYTVTSDALFAALLELYQVQNSLTLQIAAPNTAND